METLRKASPLLGESPAIQELRDFIVGVSLLNEPVLLTGGAGTGKELAARKIHAVGRTARAPFHKISCVEFRSDELETLLLGDPAAGVEGVLTTSTGGTCYLAGVEHLSRSLMQKMINLLIAERQGDGAQPRLIAGSRFSLDQLHDERVLDNEFLDLISGYHMFIPPLRDRIEDIPVLCSYQVWLHANQAEYDDRWASFQQDLLPQLIGYSWPGNVSELNEVVTRVLEDPEEGAVLNLQELVGVAPPETFDGAYLSRCLDELYRELKATLELEQLSGRSDLVIPSTTRRRENFQDHAT